MAEIVVMPRMNLTTESVLLAYWYKNEGDAVQADEALCSIEDEKVSMDLQSPASGVIAKVWAAAGDNYAVGSPVCLIAAPGEDTAALIAEAEKRRDEKQQPEAQPQAGDAPESASGAFRILPKARAIAKRSGVTIEELKAHFGDVPVSESMVELFAAAKAHGAQAPASTGRREKLSPMRKAIAGNMALSCQKTARLTNFMEVDVTAAMDRVAALKRQGESISLTALVIKACAMALSGHEIINTVLDEAEDEIVYRDEINVGFAVDVPGGLVVPVVRNADRLTTVEISKQVAALTGLAQASRLSPEDMDGGTFTVSNVGMFGIDSFTPIIRYPETAILGVGEIKTLPRYVNGDYSAVVPRKIMKIGLTYDHRVIDGAPASRFLLSIKQLLEDAAIL